MSSCRCSSSTSLDLSCPPASPPRLESGDRTQVKAIISSTRSISPARALYHCLPVFLLGTVDCEAALLCSSDIIAQRHYTRRPCWCCHCLWIFSLCLPREQFAPMFARNIITSDSVVADQLVTPASTFLSSELLLQSQLEVD